MAVSLKENNWFFITDPCPAPLVFLIFTTFWNWTLQFILVSFEIILTSMQFEFLTRKMTGLHCIKSFKPNAGMNRSRRIGSKVQKGTAANKTVLKKLLPLRVKIGKKRLCNQQCGGNKVEYSTEKYLTVKESDCWEAAVAQR
jgi:hypothetical protein